MPISARAETPNHPAGPGPAWCPTHPGVVWRDDVLPALGLSVAGAARALGVSRQALHNVLAETAAVTPEMAVRFGKLTGRGPELWLAMQQARDLWVARVALASELAAIETVTPGD